MEKGFIKLHRSITDSWLWGDKPFTFALAWIDLLLLANWKECKELYRGELVQRDPGTVYVSKTWLADRWGWDRKKVTRFLSLLERDQKVAVNGTTHGTTITIVNWGKYQNTGTTNGTTDGQPMDNHSPTNGQPLPTQKNRKKEKEGNKKAEEEIPGLAELRKNRDEVLERYKQ